MNAELAAVFPAVTLFVFSLALTAASLWLGARLAPWFLQERFDPPTVRSYFLEPSAETELTRARVVTVLLGSAILLAVLLALAVAVKFGGVKLL
jgi:hypothetical protein